MEQTKSLERICIDGVCHCDFRLTITDCEESQGLWYVHAIHASFAFVTALIGIALFGYRVGVKKYQFWFMEPTLKGGRIRPRPIEGMLLISFFYNTFRSFSSLYLLLDIAPDNLVARTFIFEFPWPFGYGAVVVYLNSIAQTVAQSRTIGCSWLPCSPRSVDAVGTLLFFLPFLLNNAFSIPIGIIGQSDPTTAIILTRVLDIAWFFLNAFLFVAVFFSAARLIRILGSRAHGKAQNLDDVPGGIIRKVEMIVLLFSLCLVGFAFFLLFFGAMRDHIITHKIGNITLALLWMNWGASSCFISQFVLVVNPRFFPNLVGSSRSYGQSTHHYDGINTSMDDQYIGGGVTLDAVTGTLPNDDDAILHAIQLKQQK
ncbi:hypothetical protein BX666DRAFT_2002701 [Dichotomocladium elegans]|nr:hypothetical protein BX666DRAFT_2002701 [Dichotomocladium elegans]